MPPSGASTRTLTVAVAGNPNSGKTTLFNALTGATARTGNHPGITVAERHGRLELERNGRVDLVDVPGSYSLNARSPDEEVAINALLGRRGMPRPDAVIVVLDATALERNLYLLLQVMEADLPVIAVVNMLDAARDDGLDINFDLLRSAFGVPVVGVVARRKQGIELLKKELDDLLDRPDRGRRPWLWTPSPALSRELDALAALVDEEVRFELASDQARRAFALWLISSLHRRSEIAVRPRLREATLAARDRLRDQDGLDLDHETIVPRWRVIDDLAPRLVRREERPSHRTERIDGLLTHPLWGSLIFLGVMTVIFQALFAWSEPVMGAIEGMFAGLAGWVSATLPPGLGRDLLVDGIIAGVGGVLVFLPQILFLFLFITLLEGSGYMSRTAFLLDRFMRRLGLHGNAFVPMLSGFACAVPGIMATRTIDDRRDRLVTIMALPLISCSARLPVYTMIIALVFPPALTTGPFRTGTLVLLGIYLASTGLTLASAGLLSRTVLKGRPRPLLIELPPYRMPDPRSILLTLRDRAAAFLSTAGTIILVITVVLWALLSFPRHVVDTGDPQADAATALRHSYAGRLGAMIEPAIEPLGFDWKIGIGLIGSFAAREVFVSTMGVAYGVGDDEAALDADLGQAMAQDRRADGTRLWTPLTGLSLMAFFMVAMQCMSTLAVTRRETGSWGWTLFMLFYLTGGAWLLSFLVYQGGRLLGYS
ncbi:MAG TPA: ferrous iron transport protein B [Candidatus Krumholzibacteria bacterium]|nr:ferrous iron transport protein B [Candidatus Krumholzibacteria bacterium]HRX50763.1 ferrous iron transport protein B [Candidatus Krumholzibacteria bacterium]